MADKCTGKTALHLKVQICVNSWTIYRDKKFVAKGTRSGGETFIEQTTGALSNELIYQLIEISMD